MDAELLAQLVALDMPGKYLKQVLGVLAAYQPQPSKEALRKRRERDRKRDMSRSCPGQVTDQSQSGHGHVQSTPAPSLPPSPPSPSPPSSTPTLTPPPTGHTHTHEASGQLALEPESLPSPAPVDANKLRVAGWFRRRPGTPWLPKELKAWKDVSKVATDDELGVLEAYYTATIPQRDDYRRKDLGTLLNNWLGEVDRARSFLARRQQRPSGKDAGQIDTRPLSQVLAEDHGIK